MQNKQHVHFIGICGVAMSALALAFHRVKSPIGDHAAGWKVTGSDKGFYPPVSTHLKEAGVSYYPGWHVDKMTANGNPDLVIVGNVAGSKNPEWLYVQEQGLEYLSYPEAVAQYLIAENSIVCAGTYGKTTSSTIMSHIMKETGMNANHMFGGLALNDLPAASIAETDPSTGLGARWSVVEGDEYKTSRWDEGAKFFHYSPTHLLLTSAVWDHYDVYPTEELYIEAFQKLVGMLPTNGIAVLSEKVSSTISEKRNGQMVTYGQSAECDYRYSNVEQTKSGIIFQIFHKTENWELRTNILGTYNADNMTGCFAMAHQIGIETQKIIDAMATFKGVKRRLERRHQGDVDVYDDIAHSPQKAVAVLESMKSLYDGKVVAVFEPNTGNRRVESIPGYDHCFESADEVIIGRLTRVKVAADDPNPPFDGAKLAEIIGKTHGNVTHIADDEALVDHIASTTKAGDVVVFLGSHGFRGMIEQLVSRISQDKKYA